MDGRLDLITLLALVVAVVAILKLRSVLGKRTGDEEARFQQRVKARETAERAASEKVVALPRRGREDQAPPPRPQQAPTAADVEAKFKAAASGDAGVEQGLLQIYRADGSFDPEHFMRGAKQAYEMIVTAFAEGNRKVLKDLLSREVFDGFSAAIADRESRGEQIDQSFVGINRAEIVEAEMKQSRALVTVRFISQLISATRDKAGQVVAGDAQRITEVTDIWTFARDTSSRNPNWQLIATQASA
jgi:predicted lipid-binding transport protein (Tim44 family)